MEQSQSLLARLTAESRFTSPGYLLATIGKTAEAWIAEAMEPLDLLPREGAALLVLRSHGELTQPRLGDYLGADANSVVMILKKLESRGLVERRRDPADRRRHLIAITDRGTEIRSRVDDAVQQVESRLLRRLDDGEIATLRELLFLVDDVAGRHRRLGEGP